ncbi:hypothetical protein FHS95_000306 [Sphingomonas naasensis]|uniref:Uncharacterized protein n=1 Tax=Sphingomonas naasensis TaxID=1344951 RepID=A0A4S1WR90_9SPHN|nr:hypothetical protein [Sphingomonas naasensis]NIJ18637.1 hypothetical protein [Sphingomonas naasensis]TGX45881.1 hypothetical protein E5A74_01505 [Sphingomonas naasensis]
MLTLFALMLQTAALDTDTAKAAKTCAQALVIASAGTDSPMRLTSHFTHLAMHAARAEGAGAKLFDRLNALSDEISKQPDLSPENAKLLAPQCDKRFPLTRSTAPVRLPADPFRRDTLCFGTLSLLQGAAQEIGKDGDSAPLNKIAAGLKPLSDKMTDAELAKRGLADDGAFMKALSDVMIASIDMGNPLGVAAACGVTGL